MFHGSAADTRRFGLDGALARSLAFRGGTALYKLYLTPAARYSEDIDLVQVQAGPAGAVMDAIQATLNPWLGKPRWKQTKGRVTFRYGFESGGAPPVKLRLKVEINTREHVAVLGYTKRPFSVRSRWFERAADILTFELDELLATKLRALYQRRKGRDLFDLAVALRDGQSDPELIVCTFRSYMERENHPLTRAMFERNLDGKLRDPGFGSDMSGLLAAGREWHATAAAGRSPTGCSRCCPVRSGRAESSARARRLRGGAREAERWAELSYAQYYRLARSACASGMVPRQIQCLLPEARTRRIGPCSSLVLVGPVAAAVVDALDESEVQTGFHVRRSLVLQLAARIAI